MKPLLSDLSGLEAVARAARSDSTRGTYARAWAQFARFCDEQGLSAIPAAQETVLAYCDFLRAKRLRPATVELYVHAIVHVHREEGVAFEPGALAKAFQAGYRRVGPARRVRKPLLVEHAQAILARLGSETPAEKLTKTLFLTGFIAGFRRSELCAMRAVDLEILPRGARITLPQSKTDQERHGRIVQIPFAQNALFCAASALAELQASKRCHWVFCRLDCRDGRPCAPISTRTVARIVKRLAASIGLDACDFSAHSLRSGFATAAAEAGAEDREIAAQTGHRDPAQLAVYVWPARHWTSNASARVAQILSLGRDCNDI